MREFEFFKIVFFNDNGAQNIKARKEPASAGLLLVGDAFGFDFVAEYLVMAAEYVTVKSKLVDTIICHRVAHCADVAVHLKRRADLLEQIRR